MIIFRRALRLSIIIIALTTIKLLLHIHVLQSQDDWNELQFKVGVHEPVTGISPSGARYTYTVQDVIEVNLAEEHCPHYKADWNSSWQVLVMIAIVIMLIR